MGIFDNARENVQKIAGAVGIPLGTAAAERVAGMDTTTALGPGTPLYPYDGVSRVPRQFDYRSGYNIVGRPRVNENVSFATLKAVINSYDVAQICISHRIDSIRSYEWMLVPAAGITDDMTDAIKLATKILNKLDPSDPDLSFAGWIAKFGRDILSYDAGALYRVRNRGGGVIGLRPIDGTTIAPLLDAWGNKPGYSYEDQAWAPAYVQFVQGITWDWLTVRDLIYSPFYPASDSTYGRAPIESILLNANTDLRFQLYFMQRFTKGNIPEGFAIAPESWTPDQLDQWQAKWDALMKGDTEILNEIKWVPPGTQFEWGPPNEFTSDFSLYLMRKTAAAFHVTPADLGFTDDVNRSTGETQASVQERVGDLPLMNHIRDILTRFLQDDVGVPLEFKWDMGNDDADEKALAEVDQIYVNMGARSVSSVAKERGFEIDDADQVVPRYVMTPQGPVPLSTIFNASTPVDGTGAPAAGTTVPGSIPIAALAPGSEGAIAKRAIEAPTPMTALTKSALSDAQRDELQTFRKSFARGRRKSGEWRAFEFRTFDKVTGHRLNVAEYASIRKADGELIAAGLVLVAADTGRVLMLQRALDDTDPAGGKWEFPGGHIEPVELPLDAALREWSEETGVAAPVLIEPQAHAFWDSPNGIYAGFVIVVPDESCCTPHDREGGLINPDDPDGDAVEAVAWWDPTQLVGNPAVRVELLADVSLVLGAISAALRDAPVPVKCPCCDGSGEHDTGSECIGCDASGLAAGYSGAVPCEGATREADPVPLA